MYLVSYYDSYNELLGFPFKTDWVLQARVSDAVIQLYLIYCLNLYYSYSKNTVYVSCFYHLMRIFHLSFLLCSKMIVRHWGHSLVIWPYQYHLGGKILTMLKDEHLMLHFSSNFLLESFNFSHFVSCFMSLFIWWVTQIPLQDIKGDASSSFWCCY